MSYMPLNFHKTSYGSPERARHASDWRTAAPAPSHLPRTREMLRLPDGSHLPLLARADRIFEIDLSCCSDVCQIFEKLALQPWAQKARQQSSLNEERDRDGNTSAGWINDRYQRRIDSIVAKHEQPQVLPQTHAIRSVPIVRLQPPDLTAPAYQHAIRPLPLPPSGKEPDPDRKEFCTYWIRRGECDFIQQGCRYKHEMPELSWLKQNGFPGGYPPWWKAKMKQSFGTVRGTGAHSLGVKSAQKTTGLPSESGIASEPEVKQVPLLRPGMAANTNLVPWRAERTGNPQQRVRPVKEQPGYGRDRFTPPTDGSHDEVTLLDLSDSDSSDSEPPLEPSSPRVPPNSPAQTAFRKGRFVPHNATPSPAPTASACAPTGQSNDRRAGPARAATESVSKDVDAEQVQRLKAELSKARKALAQSKHAVPAPLHDARMVAASTPEVKKTVAAPRAPKMAKQVLHGTAKRAKLSSTMAAVEHGILQGTPELAGTGRVAESMGSAMGMGDQAGSTEGYKYLFAM